MIRNTKRNKVLTRLSKTDGHAACGCWRGAMPVLAGAAIAKRATSTPGGCRATEDVRRDRCIKLWRYLAVPPTLMFLSGCIEITTYISPGASGTVIDAASEKPIEGATISVDEHPGLFAQTNADGQFFLVPATRRKHIFLLAPYESLPPGGTVVISADGYASKEVVVRGSADSLIVPLDRTSTSRPAQRPQRP